MHVTNVVSLTFAFPLHLTHVPCVGGCSVRASVAVRVCVCVLVGWVISLCVPMKQEREASIIITLKRLLASRVKDPHKSN